MKRMIPALLLALASSAAMAAPLTMPQATEEAPAASAKEPEVKKPATSGVRTIMSPFGPALTRREPKKELTVTFYPFAERVCEIKTSEKMVVDDNGFEKTTRGLVKCFKNASKDGQALLQSFDPKIVKEAESSVASLQSALALLSEDDEKDLKKLGLINEIDDGAAKRLSKMPKFSYHIRQVMMPQLQAENMVKFSLSKDERAFQEQKTLVLENGGIFCVESKTTHSTAKVSLRPNLAREFSVTVSEKCQLVSKLSKADNQLYLETIMTYVAERPFTQGKPVYKADYKIR
jgi:hypothetical protein